MAKSIRTAIIAAAMTLLLALGAAFTGLTAHAATSDQPTATEPQVYKTVTVADGITIKDNITFHVEKADNADGVTAPADVEAYDVEMTAAELNANKNKSFGKSLNLAAKTTKVGEYTFKVTENTPPAGWTNHSENKTYYVHVYVDKDGNHTYLITTQNTVTEGKLNGKVDKVEFTNTYVKTDGTFTVSKKVDKGDYTDKDTEYNFKATFTASSTSGNVADFVKNIQLNGAAIPASQIASDGTVTFQLKDGENANFTNVPVGVKVTVEETNRPSNVNSTSITVTSNGKTSALSGDNVKAENVLVGEGTNSVAYTNTYQDVTLTGVATKIAPFIAMVAIAGGAVALYIVSRRRRDA